MDELYTPGPSAGGVSKIVKILIICGAFFLSFPAGFANAHAVGQSLNQTVGNYIIDIGYDSIDPSPVAGEPTTFDFRFFTKETNNPADFSSVQVYIKKDNGQPSVYAEIEKNSSSSTNLIYTFPKSGVYNFTASYKQNSQVLAEGNFSLTISQADYEQPPSSPKKYWSDFFSGAIVAVFALALINMLWKIWKHKKRRR